MSLSAYSSTPINLGAYDSVSRHRQIHWWFLIDTPFQLPLKFLQA